MTTTTAEDQLVTRLSLATLAACAIGAAAASPALAAPARTLTLEPSGTKTWDGTMATGLNANYFNLFGNSTVSKPATCDTSVQYYCDTTLLKVTSPVPEGDLDGRVVTTVTVTISNYRPVPDPATDYDLLAFDSDEAGTRKDEFARDGDMTDTANERVSFTVTTTTEQPTAYALLDVVYFAAVSTQYTGTVQTVTQPDEAPVP